MDSDSQGESLLPTLLDEEFFDDGYQSVSDESTPSPPPVNGTVGLSGRINARVVPRIQGRGRGHRQKSDEVLGSWMSSSKQEVNRVNQYPVEEQPTAVIPVKGVPAVQVNGFADVYLRRQDEAREPVIKIGTNGPKDKVEKFTTNMIKVQIAENKGYFEYHVSFDEAIDDRKTRKLLLKQCEGVIGPTRNYGGHNVLYLPICLEDQEIPIKHPQNVNMNVVVRLKFVKKLELDECVLFYNILLNSIQKTLGFIEMGRNFYDPRNTKWFPKHKLEVWPGYSCRIDETESGLMLCIDVSHRVLQTTTVLEILNQIRHKEGNKFQEKFKECMVGKQVVTQYNNACYKIDDVSWETNPRNTFTRRGIAISYVDYYSKQYQLIVTDLTQPLLISRPNKRKREKLGEDRLICLIPELCNLSGLPDDMISNYEVMKDLATITQLTPQQRVENLHDFMQKVNRNAEVKILLNNWGVLLDDTFVQVEGRIIGTPDILMNHNYTIKAAKGDFSRESVTKACFFPIPLRNFVVICTRQDKPCTETMLKTYAEVCVQLGIQVGPSPGQIFTVDRVTPNDYRKILTEVVNDRVQFVIVMFPYIHDLAFGAVLKYCDVDCPIPLQVVLTKTVKNDKKRRSVMQRVALQINCKLGGAAWALGLPPKILQKKIMFVGLDVYHDIRRKDPAVVALVATLNTNCTKYFSRAHPQQPTEEISPIVGLLFATAMVEFFNENNGPPDRVIVYRDGVSDGQLEFMKATEVVSIQNVCAKYNSLFTFVIVQKRIPERYFLKEGDIVGNPPPGSVLDHTINRRYLFDFFLVSSLAKQGTVTPTHYIVLEDNSSIKPEIIQRFTLATTFMYYNWPGTIRVPAMCQYADKLAYRSAVYPKSVPSTELARQLYFL